MIVIHQRHTVTDRHALYARQMDRQTDVVVVVIA